LVVGGWVGSHCPACLCLHGLLQQIVCSPAGEGVNDRSTAERFSSASCPRCRLPASTVSAPAGCSVASLHRVSSSRLHCVPA
jgi:hypothetical protein